jgi:hypothetical protein
MRKSLPAAACLLPLACLLAGCGYTPLYGPESGGAAASRRVQVGTVEASNVKMLPGERRAAQRVAERLREDFPNAAADMDLLNVHILEQTSTLAVEKTATISRAQVTLDASLTLTSPAGKDLLQARLSSSAAYNVQDSPYSTESGKSFARLTAANNLAKEISRRLALYYAQKR